MNENEQLESTREFGRRVIQAMWDGGDVNGGDIQEWAEELGLIFRRKATKDDSQCYAEIEVGEMMYEFEDWMRVPSPPDGLPYR